MLVQVIMQMTSDGGVHNNLLVNENNANPTYHIQY